MQRTMAKGMSPRPIRRLSANDHTPEVRRATGKLAASHDRKSCPRRRLRLRLTQYIAQGRSPETMPLRSARQPHMSSSAIADDPEKMERVLMRTVDSAICCPLLSSLCRRSTTHSQFRFRARRRNLTCIVILMPREWPIFSSLRTGRRVRSIRQLPVVPRLRPACDH